MVNFGFGAHHKIVFTKSIATFITFSTKESGNKLNFNLKLFLRRFSGTSPGVISFTVRFPISNKTGAVLIQKLPAFLTFQTRRVPFQVRRDSEYVLIMYLATTSDTVGEARFFCKETKNDEMGIKEADKKFTSAPVRFNLE